MADPIPYRPSNGTEGDWFEAQWCNRCDLQGNDAQGWCSIHTHVLALSIDDKGYPAEWISDADGQHPRCTAFMSLVPGSVWLECADRCAEFGDPPCRRVEPGCKPCRECCEAVGFMMPEPLDPDAVVRPLL